jgi:hypothetical protein
MVAWDDDLMPVGELAQPQVKVCENGTLSGEEGDIPGMDQQVARGYLHVAMEFMGVGKQHDGHGFHLVVLRAVRTKWLGIGQRAPPKPSGILGSQRADRTSLFPRTSLSRGMSRT